MLELRPFWGLILWLNLCVVLWLVMVQEPVMPEAEAAMAGYVPLKETTTQQQQQQQKQLYAGKHLLSAVKPYNGSTEEQNPTYNDGTKLKYQILNVTSRRREHSNRISSNKHKTLVLKTNRSTEIPSISSSMQSTTAIKPSYNVPRRRGRPTTLPPTAGGDSTRLIDLNDFHYLIEQEACADSVQGLILVHTAPLNHKKRDLIRETWGGAIIAKTPLRLLFLLGAVVDSQLQANLSAEAAHYGDMVQGSFQDNYRNMTYKHVMALKWFLYNCAHAQILIKVDDDVYVNTPQFLEYLQRKASNAPTAATTTRTTTNTTSVAAMWQNFVEASNEAQLTVGSTLFQQPQNLLFCQRFIGAGVKRSYRSKWRVSFKEYSKQYYPPYCPGYAIIYSADVVRRLYQQAQLTRYFWIDDVHITGVLAQHTNISITTLHPYVLFSDECQQLIDGKTDLSKVEFLFSWHSISPAQIRALWILNNGGTTQRSAPVAAALIATTNNAGYGTTTTTNISNCLHLLLFFTISYYFL